MAGSTQVKAVSPARPLYVIARDIRKDWKNVWFGAVTYLEAMSSLDGIEENYGLDTAKTMVVYFLGNATQWKGEVARTIKAELKTMVE